MGQRLMPLVAGIAAVEVKELAQELALPRAEREDADQASLAAGSEGSRKPAAR